MIVTFWAALPSLGRPRRLGLKSLGSEHVDVHETNSAKFRLGRFVLIVQCWGLGDSGMTRSSCVLGHPVLTRLCSLGGSFPVGLKLPSVACDVSMTSLALWHVCCGVQR